MWPRSKKASGIPGSWSTSYVHLKASDLTREENTDDNSLAQKPHLWSYPESVKSSVQQFFMLFVFADISFNSSLLQEMAGVCRHRYKPWVWLKVFVSLKRSRLLYENIFVNLEWLRFSDDAN